MSSIVEKGAKRSLEGGDYLSLLEAALPPRTDPNYSRYRTYALSSVERGRWCVRYFSEFIALENLRVLDFGCGEGGHAVAFAEAGARAVGIDSDENRIRRAKALARDLGVSIDFRVDTQYGETLPDGVFDIIICNDVIEHVDSFERLARSHSRLLRKNGFFYLAVGNGLCLRNILSDPHYGLCGVSLLGPRLGAYYVTRVRKRTLDYEVNYFPGWYELKEIYRRNGIKLSSVSDKQLLDRLQRVELLAPAERRLAAFLPQKLFMRLHRFLLQQGWTFIGKKTGSQ